MNCYFGNHPAEYSCNCSVPNILICSSHLKIHGESNNSSHTFSFIVTPNNMNLFKEIMDKLRAVSEKIILNSNAQIRQIINETKHTLCLFNRIAQKLQEEYLSKRLNEYFLENTVASLENEMDRKIVQYYQLVNHENNEKLREDLNKIDVSERIELNNERESSIIKESQNNTENIISVRCPSCQTLQSKKNNGI